MPSSHACQPHLLMQASAGVREGPTAVVLLRRAEGYRVILINSNPVSAMRSCAQLHR